MNGEKANRHVSQRFVRFMALIGVCLTGAGLVVLQKDSSLMSDRVLEVTLRKKTSNNAETVEELLVRANLERSKAVAQLKVDYGEEYFKTLFLTPTGESIGRSAFTSAKTAHHNDTSREDVSRSRFLQRLIKKILQAQLKHEACQSQQQQQDCAHDKTPFVWVTGGHSIAAGHGNFHDQSYTAVMERTVKPVFATVNIDLKGRNYGIGGMRSAPQLALCSEALYGLDADVITWDFAATDGRSYWESLLYGHRIGVHRNRPALFGFGVTEPIHKPRLVHLASLEDLGMTALASRFEVEMIKDSLPDMQTVYDQIESIPEALRHFRCGDQLEMGDPTCKDNKFTPSDVPIKGRARWHPGWRYNALRGSVLALFLMDALVEALEELRNTYKTNPDYSATDILAMIQSQQDQEYELFLNDKGQNKSTLDAAVLSEIPEPSIVLRNRALCHTALLPSKSRYMGISSNTPGIFDEGSKYADDIPLTSNDDNEWRLVYHETDHDQYKGKINRTVKIDYKDWFHFHTDDGATSHAFPNEAELDFYLEKTSLKQASMILLCLASTRPANYIKCPQGLGMEDINSGNVTISVNDNPVSEAEMFGDCMVLLNDKKKYNWRPNDNGQYNVTVQVHPPDSILKVSSIIVL